MSETQNRKSKLVWIKISPVLSVDMSDRASNSTGGGTPTPGGGGSGNLVQIGHYILGETLGIGTFGKVKGNFA